MSETRCVSRRPHALWIWLTLPLLAAAWTALPSRNSEIGRPRDAADSAAVALLFGDRLDPNRATSWDLQLLPGIGPVRARAIAEHAKTHRYDRLRDLEDVGGIGPKTVEKLAPWLEIESAVADPRPSPQSSRGRSEASGRDAVGQRESRERSAYGRRGR